MESSVFGFLAEVLFIVPYLGYFAKLSSHNLLNRFQQSSVHQYYR
jgi:hypothetical protein